MLKAEGLRKRWGRVQALDDFSLTVRPGEICGLMGHNGAGKTTFARVCAGLERADAGRVEIAGHDVRARPEQARSRLGLAPQEIALYPTVTLRQNLRFYGGLAALHGGALRRDIEEITEAVGLTAELDRVVGTLSGGQQRRAQAATALLHRPAVLLLDEPTAGADPVTRQALLDLVRERARDGAAVCYTTHYLPELEELDATLALARAGRVVARGGRAELLAGLPGRVVLGFSGAPPADLRAAATGVTDGRELHFATDRPAHTLARLLAGLGDRADEVTAVETRGPTLDDLYLHLTSTPYTTAGAPLS
ncbi:ABC transporter ATP-binding protein [Streptomyces sp. NPDC090306]|uniref:ABC transporter ATP-binding protein n=1 Tax=Streptomyces sp. NPDC090306 TaxID=3365961 RepID=UPI0037F4DD0A